MASARVLPFVRGIDFSHNDFKDDFPKEIMKMSGLRWLKLNDTNLDWIPEEFSSLDKLESLSINKNNLMTIHGEIQQISSLRSLILRHNAINNNGIPIELFKSDELTTLDLSNNQLKQIPSELEKCKGLLVLNVSHNDIDSIPNHLFVCLTDLHYLDLSFNNFGTLPPQMRRLTNLQTLSLAHNPLGHNQLRMLQSMTALQCLNLSNTQRNLQNIPNNLDVLTKLTELNLSQNALPRVPEVLYSIKTLKRINLSDNLITELIDDIDQCWPAVEVLNLSRNQLKSLPGSLGKCSKIRRLFLNNNVLNFDGIQNCFSKLYCLEVFQASNNNLELIPESLVRCGNLKKLILSNNNLITIPDAIYFLNDLKQLDLSNNPNLVLPPKPNELKDKSLYNIDFTLVNQLKKISTPSRDNENGHKDPIARKQRLVRRAKEKANDSETSKVLKGMTELAKESEKINLKLYEDNLKNENMKPKKWEDSLEKPQLDYSDFFDETVGQLIGLTIWEIDNFCPSRLDEALNGKFYDADCYIVLKTFQNDNQNLDWEIFYWIGEQSTLDKKACSAIHAVNLRNYLSAHCRTIREEQGEESEEFLQLFPYGITYIQGGRTSSGFFTIEEDIVTTRLYRLHELSSRQLYMDSVELSIHALDSRFVYLIDNGKKIWIWNGRGAKNTVKQKARLLVEKINKEERKDKSTIIILAPGEETEEFWSHFFDYEPVDIGMNPRYDNFKPYEPIMYKVCLGTGYLELPQISYKPHPLSKAHFDTKNVYILDVYTDVYIWIGKKSQRLLRAAAQKLAQELSAMISRPKFSGIVRCIEGIETQCFKSRFASWDEVVAVDFTRTAESVQKIGADLNKWVAEHSNLKHDLSPLFMPRQPNITKEEAQLISNEWNEDLEKMEVFVLENKKFIKLPEYEYGHFYSGECYVFLCRYWIPVEYDDDEEQQQEQQEPEEEDQTVSVVYFWQGRDASNMSWLNFTFGLLKKFEAHFGKLEVVRMHQQQENLKFLSHFHQKIVIHRGKRNLALYGPERLIKSDQNELFQLRSNCDPTTLRCVEISAENPVLYSAYTYIFKVQEHNSSGVVFIWVGADCHDDDYIVIAQELSRQMFSNDHFETFIINDQSEPEIFKKLLGNYTVDRDIHFSYNSRLFRCSNDKGYFTITEKCSDFCQDDLVDEDIMILDNGQQVFIWLGVRCSEVEIKLALKSAQVYVQHMRLKDPEHPRTLMLTMKGKESRKFIKCFHGWSKFKEVKDPRTDLDKKMLPIIYEHTDIFKKGHAQRVKGETIEE